MSRKLAVVSVVVAFVSGGGPFPGPLPAQEPVMLAPAHPYLTLARSNAYRWRVHRVAARFNYNPLVPQFAAYAPQQKPFADVAAPVQRSLTDRYVRTAYGYQLQELAAEYDYYGYKDTTQYLDYP